MKKNKMDRNRLEANLDIGESNSFLQGKLMDIGNLENEGEEIVREEDTLCVNRGRGRSN